MPNASHCAKCGAPLPPDWPKGLCSRCALQGALELSNAESQVLQPDSPQGPGSIAVSEADLVMDRTGSMIGRYKLLQKIGEGGFGVVYMAEQQEPVQRKVALKIIKAGMDTREVIARFEAERQAIALMDHPNIARVLDAGATEAGRPYFVMELVRGIPITDFCDQGNLPAAERLKLFMTVCHAVQHAHQKGVIHRDIKPSNVLVTLHDGKPVPKVIDFGVAKALGQKLTQKTLFTAFHHMIGTPAYMSPEQAALSGLDVDTRADIYSLGVLLYELLTGVTPFDAETFRKAALDEIRRMIRETEPLKPSTRLTQELVAADVRRLKSSASGKPPSEEEIRASSRRLLQMKELIHLLRGDLDWIVMKCLEKDRTRRYETANGLAMDLERHLNDEPIIARPPSNLYRFQKMVQRNKLAFAAVAAIVTALMLGVVVSTWQAIRATRAEREQSHLRQTAQSEASKSKQVARFLKDMLESANPDIALGQDTTLLRRILNKTTERVGRELKDQPEVEAELRSTIGTTYFELGDYQKAVEMHREALRLRKSVFGETNEFVAVSLNQLGAALEELGDLAEAETMQRTGLAMRRKLFGNEHPNLTYSLTCLANVLQKEGKLAETETLAREAVAIQRKISHKEHSGLATSLNHLGSILLQLGKVEGAEKINREALAMWRRLNGNESPGVATSLQRLGMVLLHQRRWPEAEIVLREALELRRKLLGPEHQWVASSVDSLAVALGNQGKLAEAESLHRERLAIATKNMGNKNGVANTLNRLAIVLRSQGKTPEAEATYREMLTLRGNIVGNAVEHGNTVALNELAWLLGTSADAAVRDGPRAVVLAESAVGMTNRKNPAFLATLAAAYAETGRFAEAVQVQDEAIGVLENENEKQGFAARLKLFAAKRPFRQPSLSGAAADLLATGIASLLNEGKFAEAEPLARACLAIREEERPDDWIKFESLGLLGGALVGQKKYTEAEPLLLSAYEGLKQREDKTYAEDKVRLKKAVQRVVQLYEETGRPAQAAEWQKKLAEFDTAEK